MLKLVDVMQNVPIMHTDMPTNFCTERRSRPSALLRSPAKIGLITCKIATTALVVKCNANTNPSTLQAIERPKSTKRHLCSQAGTSPERGTVKSAINKSAAVVPTARTNAKATGSSPASVRATFVRIW